MTATFTAGITFGGGGFTFTPPSTDPYFEYTTLLLPGNGPNNATNNTFIDSSTNNSTITRGGNPTQGTFTPFGNNWSGYFDGTDDYLTIPDNVAFEIGDVDFTIEAWFNISALPASGFSTIFSKGASGIYQPYTFTINSSGSCLYYSSSNGTSWNIASAQSFGTITTGVWYNVAVSRSGSNTRMFLNGALVNTIANSGGALYNNTRAVAIGGRSDGTEDFTGFISNVRLLNGTALYTSAFTPSTIPLTAITNTQLLACQSNRFIDNSTNNFTITQNGNSAIQRFSPFSPTAAYNSTVIGGSGYFYGTGDYLQVANNASNQMGTGDWTTEAWIYITDYTLANPIMSKGGSTTDWSFATFPTTGVLYVAIGTTDYFSTTGPVVPLNVWNHVALVRSGTTLTTYLNGVLASTLTGVTQNFTSTGALNIGRGRDSSGNYLTGYISNSRLVKGTAVYTSSFTPPTSPLTAITNTSLLCNYTNAGIIDNTMITPIETIGNVSISTNQSKFGGSSMYFNGVNARLYSVNTHTNNTFSGVYTAECWFYSTSLATDQVIWFNGVAGSDDPRIQLTLRTTGRIDVYSINTGVINYYPQSATGLVSANTWYYVAVVSNGTTVTAYLNGTSVASATITGTPPTVDAFYIGYGRANSTSSWFVGYIDDFRLTTGYARYTSNFSAPTVPFLLQ